MNYRQQQHYMYHDTHITYHDFRESINYMSSKVTKLRSCAWPRYTLPML